MASEAQFGIGWIAHTVFENYAEHKRPVASPSGNTTATASHSNRTSEYDGAGLDLRCITELISRHQSNSAHCCSEDTVFILGNTGVGKSTTINYVCGRKIVMALDESEGFVERLDVVNPLEGCEVGHGGDSLTRYLQCVVNPASSAGNNLVFCDTPGFEDTEGSVVNIANAVAISWSIRQCKSVRLVLLIDASMFASQRGVELNKLLQLFKRFLINTDVVFDSVKQALLFIRKMILS
jgi:GTP-binding protein EngB required for normal cell division